MVGSTAHAQLGRRSWRHRGRRSDFTALIWLCDHKNITFLEADLCASKRCECALFVSSRFECAMRSCLQLSGLDSPLGCAKEPGVVLYMAPIPSDASAEVMPPGVPIYGVFFPDSAPNLSTDSIDAQASDNFPALDGGSGLDIATDELIVY